MKKKFLMTSKLEFMSSKDPNEKREMYIISFNLEIMMGKDTDEILTLRFCMDTDNLYKQRRVNLCLISSMECSISLTQQFSVAADHTWIHQIG